MSFQGDYRSAATLSKMAQDMNDREIGEAFGVTSQTIRYWRRIHGIPARARLGNIKYSTNRAYFSRIDTPEKAYILGFIVADGSVHKNGKSVTVAVKEEDAPLLLDIAKHVECNASLHRKTGRGFGNIPRTTLALHICGKRIVSDLAILGVKSNKSVNATYPTIPERLERHLIRGLFDGDGYVGKRQFSIVGTEALIHGVVEAVEYHTGCKLSLQWKNDHLYAVGSRRDQPAIKWMYSNASIGLTRKIQAYQQYWL
ncbi:hypothetical protein AB0L44_02065 [Nonomuraea wenchangensis]|uniref:hypothetical protein n=1 Tax=Nonomuraea wenchangensis TaxID=568860 RepID=UPI00342DDDA5